MEVINNVGTGYCENNLPNIVSFHLGQAGCQIANSQWELFCSEHAISPDGSISSSSDPDSIETNRSVFFSSTPSQRFTSRSLLIDLEPTVIDEIRCGTYRNLFKPSSYVDTNMGDAGSNFARGYYTIGKTIFRRVMDETRRLVEECDRPVTFFMTRALGGGTGGGTGSLIFENLVDEFSKVIKMEIGVIASAHLSTSPVEPYNTLFSVESSSSYSDCTSLVDNESLYKILKHCMNIHSPTYSHINRVITQAISGMFASIRFPGYIHANLASILTNLIPYPRIHFPIVNFSPICNRNQKIYAKYETEFVTLKCFSQHNSLLGVSPLNGKYVSCCMLFRGNTNPNKLVKAIQRIKTNPKIRFVDWTPTGFKVGHSCVPSTDVPNSSIATSPISVCMLSNNSIMSRIFRIESYKFETLYDKNSFIHWFIGEGMETEEFSSALENMRLLEKDYMSLESWDSQPNALKNRRMSDIVVIESTKGVESRMRKTVSEEEEEDRLLLEIYNSQENLDTPFDNEFHNPLDQYFDDSEKSL